MPNPTNGHLQLLTQGFPAEAQVTVLQADGHLVLRQPLGSGQLDLSAMPTGLYFIRVEHDRQQKTISLEKSGF
jgi:hypothetical protein